MVEDGGELVIIKCAHWLILVSLNEKSISAFVVLAWYNEVKSHTDAKNVGNALPRVHTFWDTGESTLERNHTSVMSMGNVFLLLGVHNVTCTTMSTLERNHRNTRSTGNILLRIYTFWDTGYRSYKCKMESFLLLFLSQIICGMRESTQEWNQTNARVVGNISLPVYITEGSLHTRIIAVVGEVIDEFWLLSFISSLSQFMRKFIPVHFPFNG